MAAVDARFQARFERWARRVRRRLALRQALSGAAIGLSAALVPAGIAWQTRHPDMRAAAPLLGGVGLLGGLLAARRRRWSDGDIALYLDGRLSTEEAIATALELHQRPSAGGADDGASFSVVTSATNALTSAAPAKVRPAILKPVHALVPVAVAGLIFIARSPLPAAKASAEPPGTTKVQVTEVEGLDKIAKLARLDPRDDAQRERLAKIAKDAEKLKEELLKGMEKRDAQDKIARLREAISEERLSLGDGEKRAGLESAVSKLEEHDLTRRAGRALGDHDLETVDREMERIANEREKADRELAKNSLDQAADTAKKNGAPDVARALEEEKKSLERREARSQTLRDLADAMKGTGEATGEIKSESEALDREGSDKASQQLAESMSKALEKLTPEERKRLAEKLRRMAKESGASGDRQQLKDLADDLSTPEGQKKLEDQLKEMAKDDAESGESRRQKALDEADEGAKGAVPIPGGSGSGGSPGAGSAGAGKGGKGGTAGNDPAKGAGGHGSHDVGTGDHAGSTAAIEADGMKSRAHGPMNKGQAMPGSVSTFLPGKAGGTANTRGTGDLRVVGPKEVDGVERSDVPEEYREHVRQYFQP